MLITRKAETLLVRPETKPLARVVLALLPEGSWLAYGGLPAFLFAYSYIPVVALFLSLAINSVLKITFSLILPLYLDSDGHVVWERSLVQHALSLLSHYGLIVGVIIAYYRVMACIVECMVDAFRRKKGMAYVSLASQLRGLFLTKLRAAYFLSMLAVCLAVFHTYAWTNFLIVWESRSEEVLMCAWTVFVTQGLYVFGPMLLSLTSRDFTPSRVFDHYWQSIIPIVRRNIVLITAAFFARWVLRHSVISALAWLVESMLYLISPHVFLACVAALATSLVQVTNAVVYLIENYNTPILRDVVCAGFGNFGLLLVTAAYFRTIPVVVLCVYIYSVLLVRVLTEVSKTSHGVVGTSRWMWYEQDPNTLLGWWTPVPHHIAVKLEACPSDGSVELWPLDDDHTFDVACRIIRDERDSLRNRAVDHVHMRQWPLRILGHVVSINLFRGTPKTSRTLLQVRRILKYFIMVFAAGSTVVVTLIILQGLTEVLQPNSISYATPTPDELHIAHVIARLRVSTSKSAANESSLPTTDVYNVCSRDWHGVSVYELSVFSMIVYLDAATQQFRDTLDYFRRSTVGGTHWQLRHSSDPRREWVTYHDYYNPHLNVSVVSVRGTDPYSAPDLWQNVNMYVEVFLYHLWSYIVPGVGFLPHSIVVDYIKLASLVENIGGTTTPVEGKPNERRRHYWSDVYAYVSKIKDRKVLLTGHSLGGAIGVITSAQLVGTDTRAVTFGSPGVMLSYKKFDIRHPDRLYRDVHIQTEHDPVPTIDLVVGESHSLQCRARRQDVCHAVEFSFMELWRSCPTLRRTRTHITSIVEDNSIVGEG